MSLVPNPLGRGAWFVAGTAVGLYAAVRARRVAEALTPDGLADRVNGLAHGARLLRDEVAQGRAEKEDELRQRLGLPVAAGPSGRPALSAAPAPAPPGPLLPGASPHPRTAQTRVHDPQEGRP